jgi:hypothetical protein
MCSCLTLLGFSGASEAAQRRIVPTLGAGKPKLPENEDLHSQKIHINHKSVYYVIVVVRGGLFGLAPREDKT